VLFAVITSSTSTVRVNFTTILVSLHARPAPAKLLLALHRPYYFYCLLLAGDGKLLSLFERREGALFRREIKNLIKKEKLAAFIRKSLHELRHFYNNIALHLLFFLIFFLTFELRPVNMVIEFL
jgi:hypothetical protein